MRAVPRWLVVCGAFCASLAAAQAEPDESRVDPKFKPQAEKARREGDKVFQWIRLHSASLRQSGTPAAEGAAGEARAKAPAQASGSDRAKAPQARGGAPVATPPARAATPAPAALPRAATAGTQPPPGPASTPAPTAVPMPVPAVALPAGPASAPGGAMAPASPAGATEPFAAASAPPAANPGAGPRVPAPSGQPGAAAPGIAEPDDGEATLVLVEGVEPEFSPVLMRRLRKGWVEVRLVVNPDGSVAQVEVTASSHPRLHEPALAAAKRWVFRPPGQAREATAELGFDLDGL